MRKIVLLRDAGYLFSSDAAMIALGLLGQIILTHSLPTAEYGSWVIVIDLLGILFLLVHFGIPDVLGRDAPRIGSRIARILKFYTTYQLATALVFGPIVIMILLTFLSLGLSLYTTIFLSISVASQLLGATYRMILRSLGEARTEGFLRILDRGLVITGYLINYSFLGGSIEVFAIATAIGPFSTLPLAIWKSRSLLAGIPTAEKSSVSEEDFSRRELLFRALPFFITSGLLLVINRVDKLVLLYFTGPDAILDAISDVR